MGRIARNAFWLLLSILVLASLSRGAWSLVERHYESLREVLSVVEMGRPSEVDRLVGRLGLNTSDLYALALALAL